MQKQILLLTVLFTFILSGGWAYAGATYNFEPPDPDIRDLPHEYYFEWGINLNNDYSDLAGRIADGTEEITDASFTFKKIYDYSSGLSTLYVNLIDGLPTGLRGGYDGSSNGNFFETTTYPYNPLFAHFYNML